MKNRVEYTCHDCERTFQVNHIEGGKADGRRGYYWQTQYCPFCGNQKIEVTQFVEQEQISEVGGFL